MPRGKLIAKYKARFREAATKESREDGGAGPPDGGAGPAPVPAPRRPVAPTGSFCAGSRPLSSRRDEMVQYNDYDFRQTYEQVPGGAVPITRSS